MTKESTNLVFLPLEANPELFASYVKCLAGPYYHVDAENKKKGLFFEDLLSLEPWAIDMLKCKRTVGLLLLFPLSQVLKDNGPCSPNPVVPDDKIWFIKQTIPNACGTIALLHCLANLSKDEFVSEKGGIVDRFFASTRDLSAADRAIQLEQNKEITDLHLQYQDFEGTKICGDEIVDIHYTYFTCVDGHIVELDGRNEGPIRYFPIEQPELFLEKCIQIIKEKYIDPSEDKLRFTILTVGDALTIQKENDC